MITESEQAAILLRHLNHLRARGLAPIYIDQRRRVLRGLGAAIGKNLMDITIEDLAEWQAQGLGTRTTGRSRNTLLSHVREFYRWCHAEEFTPDDRGRKIVRSKQARLVPRPIGEGALQVAIGLAPPRVKPMLLLAAYEGLRACEIANLRREDVRDHDSPETIVVLGKGSKERVLPVSQHVLMALHEHGMPARGAIFTMWTNKGPTSQPISPHRVSATCNAYLAEINAGATLHQLRHRFGTQALRLSGGDLRLTQELLGHASPATTAIYTQWATDRASSVIDALSALALTVIECTPQTQTTTED